MVSAYSEGRPSRPTSIGALTTRGDFGDELKRRRTERRLTQRQAAEGLGVERATIAQWELGKHLPSAEKAQALDEYFGAEGSLAALAVAARTGSGVEAPARTMSLTQIFAAVGDALVRTMIPASAHQPPGWPQKLGSGAPSPSPMNTCHALRTLNLLDYAAIDVEPIVAGVLARQHPSGGWAYRDGPPRPEVTAVVVDTLTRVGATTGLENAWRWLETESVNDAAFHRPYVTATVLETAVRLRPGSSLCTTLVKQLLEARRPFESDLLWSANAAPGVAKIEPSLAHTARAAAVLQRVSAAPELQDAVQDAVGQAVEWIVGRGRGDDGTSEQLRIDPGPPALDIIVNHFSSAWVLRVLAGSDAVPQPRVQAALDQLWDSYSAPDGLWAWTSDGTLPVWMTHDAVAALRITALARFHTPVTLTRQEDG